MSTSPDGRKPGDDVRDWLNGNGATWVALAGIFIVIYGLFQLFS